MWIDLIGHVCARPNKTKKDDLIALLKRLENFDLRVNRTYLVIDLEKVFALNPGMHGKYQDLKNLNRFIFLINLFRISQSDLLHPLVVLEMLSKDDSLQVGDIRDYIVAWLERQNAAIKTSENKLSEQQKRLEGMNAEIDDLENK